MPTRKPSNKNKWDQKGVQVNIFILYNIFKKLIHHNIPSAGWMVAYFLLPL